MASSTALRFLVIAPIAALALVVNPSFGASTKPNFGEAELRAAVEGRWQLTLETEQTGRRVLTFELAQGDKARRGHASLTLVRPAVACTTRTFVKSAGACGDLSILPLAATLVADGARQPQPEPGELMVEGARFTVGGLHLRVADLMINADLLPDGTVKELSIHREADRVVSAALVRRAR